MNVLPKLALANLFYFTALSVSAQGPDSSGQQTSANTSSLVTYLTNLGKYLGYDITKSSQAPNPPYSQLLNVNVPQLIQNYAYYTFLGAIPVNTISQGFMNFVTSDVPGNSLINNSANNTFKNQNYSAASSLGDGKIAVNNVIDQSTTPTETTSGSGVFSSPPTQTSGTYLKDPVSQAIYNILGTPNYTYCMTNNEQAWLPSCNLKYDNLVMQNVLANIPPSDQFYTYSYNQLLISDLNSDSLIAPLLLNTSPTPQQLSGNTPPGGLKAVSQAQAAANFIRYASAQVTPPSLPKFSAYSKLYNQATSKPGDAGYNEVLQKQAATTISNYFNNLHIYAAQTSVGVSNLYYILSKRLPQKLESAAGGQSADLPSQALTEFRMATRRLFDPTASNTAGKTDSQWLLQINEASPATIQKEIAILLAEINYQMYLDRQLQERILMTNSVMLLQNLKAAQPNNADISSQSDSSSEQ